MVDKDAVRRGYDELAEAYAADRNEDGHGREVLSVSRRVSESARPRRRLRTGDAGASRSGLGGDRRRDRHLAFATGAGRRERPRRGARARRHGGAPLRNGSFDAVTAYHSLIHVPREQHQEAVDEFARVLADGGLCSEGPDEWSGTNPDWLDTGVEMQWHIAGVEATRDHLRNAGFTVEREWRTDDSLAEGDDANWTFFAARLEE